MLDRADFEGVGVSMLTLQKLLYFAHGWFLAIYDRPLVYGEFEAWEYGPVLKSVYKAFPKLDDRFITSRALRSNHSTGEMMTAADHLEERVERLLDQVFAIYGRVPAFKLSTMTHVEGGPWYVTRRSADTQVNSRLIIENRIIREYFRDRIDQGVGQVFSQVLTARYPQKF